MRGRGIFFARTGMVRPHSSWGGNGGGRGRRACRRGVEVGSSLKEGIVSALGKGSWPGGASAVCDRLGRGGLDLGGEEAGENRCGGGEGPAVL